MRQITKESVKAFMNAEKFSKSNMLVEVLPNVTILKYHGNSIAYKYNNPKQTISITNCGWETTTTKERLNGVIELAGLNIGKIYQKNWQWYLDGKEWNGNTIDLN
tara:strand:+ start:600 stop:914 length:315 start_codon:yes stop_codon:yes gene_type:complete